LKTSIFCFSYRIMRLIIFSILISLAYAKIREINVIKMENNIPDTNFIEGKGYRPNWRDLDKRPLPEWYDKAKIGIFLHWGVYAVPSFGSEWFWMNWKSKVSKYVDFMDKNYPPNFTYQEFAPMFTAEFFEPAAWAQLFSESGAKYIVLTSKHHEGFTLFPSKRSFSWNSVDVGPKRDLVGELSVAVRKRGLKFGVYHSLYEWYNPIYLQDKNASFETHTFVDTKLWPDLKQIVHDYKPSVIWSDGDWEAPDNYWRSTDLLAWLYNDSPVKDEIVVNDRWGKDIPGHHGDFYNHADRFNPGNALINVGPTKEGTIIPVFQERLLFLGKWLAINGEAIYGSSPWFSQNDTVNGKVWYTCTKETYNATHPTYPPSANDKILAIYAIALEWPKDNWLILGDITSYLHRGTYQVELLGNKGLYLTWKISNGKVGIQLPDKATVRSRNAWTLKFTLK
ncbi:hypothetical protein HF086_009782, partial [Spodoptera exigua]